MINLEFGQIFKLMRPKQWIKNFFVFAAMIFSGKFTSTYILIMNIFVFIMFCLISSSVYVLNDLVDVSKDRQHPQKKNRPIASGKVTKFQAILVEIILLAVVFIISYNINLRLLAVFLIYFIMNVLYSFKLKNIIIVDVMIITFGFVLRVESGSILTNVQLSPWMILCTILISLFMALNKRKSEIITLKDKSGAHRKILDEYSVELIDNMLTIVTPSILIAYCLYTFSSIQSRTMMITIPFVLYGIFRYQYLMMKNNIGGKPEDVFQKDIPFLINIILWAVVVISIIYFKL
ncbi:MULTISPECIES: decaprenyl-phosphate phosphoribosyltransferase [Clostridium]|jgi:4-hydroxybenzoate polyprenyltransferase|uniref:decaprenyl-phosphate phosphoribosyltransferase n=1 Tax=Clostridium TaxID=1485 RepID=UPI00028816AA|nr:MULTISPECIES: decaprenyl-phosphate phosphoribosyltransferase [Clostridium]MDF2502525.1 4-hydroxybenzoate polyprenyltransferase-like prenyltransferase [Clostridium sp.]